jgi:hypothetical protein
MGFRAILPPLRINPNLLAKSRREASELNPDQEQIMAADDLKPWAKRYENGAHHHRCSRHRRPRLGCHRRTLTLVTSNLRNRTVMEGGASDADISTARAEAHGRTTPCSTLSTGCYFDAETQWAIESELS